MEHVDRIAQLVATTTPTACAYLSSTVAAGYGLLDGDEIIEPIRTSERCHAPIVAGAP
jgi:hypothetical protein